MKKISLLLLIISFMSSLVNAECDLSDKKYYYIKASNGQFLVPNFTFHEISLKNQMEPDARVQIVKTSDGIALHFQQIGINKKLSGFFHSPESLNEAPYFSSNSSSYESYKAIKQADGKYYLKTFHNTYLTPNFGKSTIEITDQIPSEEAKFEFIEVQPCAMKPQIVYENDSRFFFYLQANNKKFIVPDSEDDYKINMKATPSAQGQIEIIGSNGQTLLKFSEGYLHTSSSHSFYQSQNPSAYESYELQKADSSSYYIKTNHEQTYLSIDEEQNVLCAKKIEGDSLSQNEQFCFIPANAINPDKCCIFYWKNIANANKEQLYRIISSSKNKLENLLDILNNCSDDFNNSASSIDNAVQIWESIKDTKDILHKRTDYTIFNTIDEEIGTIDEGNIKVQNVISSISKLIQSYKEILQDLEQN